MFSTQQNNKTLTNDSDYVVVEQEVAQNSSYTIPETGTYSIRIVATTQGTAGVWYLDSNRTKQLFVNANTGAVSNSFFFKKDTVIYTRAGQGQYFILGYFK